MPLPCILGSNLTDAPPRSGNRFPDASRVLATNIAPLICLNWPFCTLFTTPCPITRTIPFQFVSGSYVKVPVTRRRPYPSRFQLLTSRLPLTTTVSGLLEVIPNDVKADPVTVGRG